MNIDIATLFPEMLENYLSESVVGRARAKNIFTVTCHNIRDYTQDKHRRVDDTPYSERQGMLMQCEPIYNCYKSVTEGKSKPHVIYMSPQGKTLTQKRAKELSRLDNIFILCGHYEGVDSRVIDEIVDEEISVGDYVLTGGELPLTAVTTSIRCSGMTSVCENPLQRSRTRAISASVTRAPAHIPIMPSLTIDGVFGIVRITFKFRPSTSSNHTSVFPGAMDTRICSSVRRSLISSNTSA